MFDSPLLNEIRLSSWLWEELRNLFDTDDGSLPEIRVNYADTKATPQGYAILRSRASANVSKHPYFWSKTEEKERFLNSVPNPAALVVSGEAEPFHVVFDGIALRGVNIPNLGVFVFPNQFTIDYRMGVDWNAEKLAALFELLAELSRIDPHSSISLDESAPPEAVARFQTTWRRYQGSIA